MESYSSTKSRAWRSHSKVHPKVMQLLQNSHKGEISYEWTKQTFWWKGCTSNFWTSPKAGKFRSGLQRWFVARSPWTLKVSSGVAVKSKVVCALLGHVIQETKCWSRCVNWTSLIATAIFPNVLRRINKWSSPKRNSYHDIPGTDAEYIKAIPHISAAIFHCATTN